jgi:non-lysosomal glucosylceramidase
MFDDLKAIHPRFAYTGERTRYIAFPLGGIGAGGFAISGSGRLVDWSIRNRPALQNGYNGYSHFAIKAERDGVLVDARVLNGPYDLNPSGSPGVRRMFEGFGHGANRQTLVGVPHFRTVDFYGRFPTADLVFKDERFPGGVRLTAVSPFIPHNDRDSSMPVAMFEFEIVNTTGDALTYTLAGTLGNHGANSGTHTFAQKDGIKTLHLTASEPPERLTDRGDLTIATDAADVDHTDHHYRGQWFDDLAVYWKDFARPGRLPERHYAEPRRSRHMSLQPEHGTLAARLTVPAGESRKVRFVISWSFPHGDIYWAFRNKPDGAIPDVETPHWTNYYSRLWADSEASARDALRRWDELTGATAAFRDGLFGSSLPAEIIDAASSTLALLRTATVIRLENGELWGWEGQHTNDGSCEGSCTHVWNYQQALAHLFPAIERSLRETELTYNQLPSGGLTFRQKLPLGSGFDMIGPCADGHFGAIIKTYRDWRLSGDTAWLKRWWPALKRAIEYAWSPQNPDRWDPEQTGILSGRQHQTLDMELFGPNSWLGSMYVAALLAAAKMARAVGEGEFGDKLEAMGRNGARYLDEKLFNGRWYIQDIDVSDRSVLEPFAGRNAGVLGDGFIETYWSDEHGEIKYQMGEGCISDQILGQWHAEVAGIGRFLDDRNVETALRAVHRHNFRPSLADHFNPCRNYACEDEGGLLIATYPEGVRQPMVAAPYAEEVWTGIEYMSASHMIMRGLVEEGLEVVRTARDRHDGSRRNPWNDIECGSYYARSMSAWQLVNAWSGLQADFVEGTLSFAPAIPGDQRLFWSAGTAFGHLVIEQGTARLEVIGGTLPPVKVIVNGTAI